MQLGPDIRELLARSRADLRMGVPVVLRTSDHAVAVLAAETIQPGRLAALLERETAPVLVITARRAETLKARAYDGDLARVSLPKDADTTWIRAVADPAADLSTPLKGPFMTLRDGSAEFHRVALALVKSALLLPAALVVQIDDADSVGLTSLELSEVKANLKISSPLHRVADAKVPVTVSENARLGVFRPEDGGEEHYALEIGDPDRAKPVLTRLHSACFTGDLLGSLKCDCGPQLRAALAQMGKEGQGVLLYLNQEGRGIGLANKMRAYALQDQGFDTVDANHRLGFEDDERDFRLGAELLKSLRIRKIRLLTNNPAKIEMMQANGIDVVERVPLAVGETSQNRAYLATKAAKSGHLF